MLRVMGVQAQYFGSRAHSRSSSTTVSCDVFFSTSETAAYSIAADGTMGGDERSDSPLSAVAGAGQPGHAAISP